MIIDWTSGTYYQQPSMLGLGQVLTYSFTAGASVIIPTVYLDVMLRNDSLIAANLRNDSLISVNLDGDSTV